MKTDFMLCSVQEDLVDIDKANLRMNGILMSNSFTDAIQPLFEGELGTLFITDSVIEEQSSLIDVTKSIKILYKIYPKNIRIIYIKRGVNVDSLTELMDMNSNWDVYYNSQLSDFKSEDIIQMFGERKIPEKRKYDRLAADTKTSLIKKANVISKGLLEELANNKDAEENDGFKGLVFRNINMVRDMVLSFEELKKDIKEREINLEKQNVFIEKYIEDLKDAKERDKNQVAAIKGLEQNRKDMLMHLRELENRHNSLVNNLKDFVNVADTNTRLSKTLYTDKYREKSPTIIYFKEYTSLNYFTSYLMKLNEISMKTMGLSRILIIENDLHVSKIPLYEERDFVYVTEGTSVERIVLGNLVCCGNNNRLLNYMVQNSFQLDVLFIFDRTGASYDIVEGMDVIKFGLTKNMEDAKALGLTDMNIITNDVKSPYHLETIDNYKQIANSGDLELSAVTAMELTRKLIQFMKSWEKIESTPELPNQVDLSKV